MRITVDKSRRRLVLRHGRYTLLRCSCRLGSAPIGPKTREGDGRTPEGRYFVCSRNPRSKYHLALGISYPNCDDAARALQAGRILAQEAEAIRSAQHKGLRPPWDTSLGGWIMIHGEPSDGRDPNSDWTAGCIALRNRDMEKLYRYALHGTKVVIRP